MIDQEKIFGAPGTGKTYNLIDRLQNHLNKNCPFSCHHAMILLTNNNNTE